MKPGDLVKMGKGSAIALYNSPYPNDFSLPHAMESKEIGIVLEVALKSITKDIREDHVKILTSTGKVGWKETEYLEVIE